MTEGDFDKLLVFIVEKCRFTPRQSHSHSCRSLSHVATFYLYLPAGYFSCRVDGERRLIGFYSSGFIKHLTIFRPETIGTFFSYSTFNKGRSTVLKQANTDYSDKQIYFTRYELYGEI